jgi:hypothetical protein
MRRLALGLAVGTAALAAAAPAWAVTPDRTFTFGADPATSAWDGGPGFGLLLDGTVSDKVGCNPAVHTCDWTFLKVDQPGDVVFQTEGTSQTNVDMDVHFYVADADATPGEMYDESVAFSPDETLAESVDPGYYLVLVDYLTAVAGTYHGSVQFTPTGTP